MRSAPGPLEAEVVVLDVGRGPLEILHGFGDDGACDRILIERAGGVRALWADGRRERRHPAPRLTPGRRTRISFDRGALAVDGRVVLHVQERPGRRGLGVRDGAADFRVVSPRTSGSSR